VVRTHSDQEWAVYNLDRLGLKQRENQRVVRRVELGLRLSLRARAGYLQFRVKVLHGHIVSQSSKHD
jgi:hypothetical protein